ncbi:MAG: HEAT repeat domain-containing protein [Planctomycetota bacterium]|jgi:HEAT repeat protein
MKKTGQDNIYRKTDDTKPESGIIMDGSLRLVKGTGKVVGTGSKMLNILSNAVMQSGGRAAEFGVKSVAAAKGFIDSSLSGSALIKSPPVETISKTSNFQPTEKQAAEHKPALKALVAALESNLEQVRRELEKTKSQAEYVRAQFQSQIEQLNKEKKLLLSELKKTGRTKKNTKSKSSSKASAPERKTVAPLSNDTGQKAAVALAEPKLKSETQTTPEKNPQTETMMEQCSVRIPDAEDKTETPVGVTMEEVDTADWPNAGEKIIFTKALSDIAGRDVALRSDAVRTLATIPHELSVRVLAAQITREPSLRVRQQCLKALMKLNIPEGAVAAEYALNDKVASVRLAAVQALYRLAPSQSAAAFVRMFYDEDEDVRRRAVVCIGWLKQKNLAEDLLPLLNDTSISVRRAAIEAMAGLRSPHVVSTLIENLSDSEESIRKAVIGALQEITGKKMNGQFPKDQKSLQRLIARWQQWWKEQPQN